MNDLLPVSSHKNIPHYRLTPQTRNGIVTVDLSRYEDYSRHVVVEPHRDDHFTLLALQSGRIELSVDFEPVTITTPTFFLIAPEQIHQLVGMTDAVGWLVNVETGVFPDDLRVAIDHYLRAPLPLEKDPPAIPHVFSLLRMADELRAGTANGFVDKAIQSVVLSVVSLGLSLGESNVPATYPVGRNGSLYRQFKVLLEQHYRTWKQTSVYAASLAISASHLNDTVKAVSGWTVSAHIQTRNILEAKRMLYTTDLTAGEIGFALGYEDPVYFGKLFKKHTQLTPQGFRAKFRE